MSKLRTGVAIATAVVTAAAFAPGAIAKGGGGGGGGGTSGGGGGGLQLPGGGGDLGGGGGGVVTPPAPSATNITGTWTGVESSVIGNPVVLSVTQDRDKFTGTYTRIVAGDSPIFKIQGGSVTGNQVHLSFSQGGKPGLHPDVGLSGVISDDGRTITGIFGTTPVTLTR
jgi:hypothetical protein